MKKILFFLFVFLFVAIFCIKNVNVIDKELHDNDFKVNYPYFSKYNINNEIYNYITKTINNSKGELILDYDYNDKEKLLTFYKTEINNNILDYKNETFKIGNNNFYKTNNIKEVNDYDFYNNRYIDKNTKLVAFTFDDGPNYNTSKIIDVLNKYNVTATFFVMGKNIK